MRSRIRSQVRAAKFTPLVKLGRRIACVRLLLRPGGYGEKMLDLRPGDYVECVDNSPRSPISTIMPESGRLYTVEEVRFIAGGYSLRLNELAPSCSLGGPCTCGDCGWDARRFRRVYRPEARKLELFKAMLRITKPAIADPVPID